MALEIASYAGPSTAALNGASSASRSTVTRSCQRQDQRHLTTSHKFTVL
jgi:hypothetical protein